MKISVGLGNQTRGVDPGSLVGRAVHAEELGFASVSTVGRIAFPGVPDTVALAAAAGATRRIGLLSGVLVAPAWGPVMLAKELAGIAALSGGRLSAGIGLGSRSDDYLDGTPAHRGRRLDHDIAVYRRVWAGERIENAALPLIPPDLPRIPLLFGGVVPAAMARMARLGDGYIGASWAPELIAPLIESARQAWEKASRPGRPRIVALAYSALTSPELGREQIASYYIDRPEPIQRRFVDGVALDSDQLRRVADAYRDLGVDEFFVNPSVPDPSEVDAIATALL